MKLIQFIDGRNRSTWIVIGFLLLCLVGVLDYETGNEISFSLFYVFPIALITRIGNWKFGALASLVAAFLWLMAEVWAGTQYSHPAILYWNIGVRFSIFLLMSLSIKLGRDLESESIIARTDFVTGALNSRYFNERLQIEVDRAARYEHPFTITYFDVDNFKSVNDRFGHSTGDKVLRAIVDNLKQILRKTDVIARVGGDEFALLLPETNMDVAQIVISKAHKNLLAEMIKHEWPVTFSIGVITFTEAPPSVDTALEMADKIMYEVKTHGKNNVLYVNGS